MNNEEILKWATELAEKKAVVFHKEHMRVGQIDSLLTEGGKDLPAKHDPIFLMTSGDSFFANPKSFEVLDDKETRLFETMSNVLATVLVEMKTLIISLQLRPIRALTIIGSVLRLQSDLILRTDNSQDTF